MKTTFQQNCASTREGLLQHAFASVLKPSRVLVDPVSSNKLGTHLVEVDDRLPEVVLLLVVISHTNLAEVTRMVLVPALALACLLRSKKARFETNMLIRWWC
jgi:hypothetical protein